uniref:Alternative protein PRDM5 n=1 Tax=Homo sapiens TaxID=9606 RepID=L0R6M5_HUMAN|nr:alternative protein PRDM5 [Homo sapiens]
MSTLEILRKSLYVQCAIKSVLQHQAYRNIERFMRYLIVKNV